MHVQTINTSNILSARPYIDKLYTPPSESKKGDNGKLLVIGGSGLFHAASIWAADMASKVVDMVHYASTEENNQILTTLKQKFLNGIVISRKDIPLYVSEDDCILIGNGMMRGDVSLFEHPEEFDELLMYTNEAHITHALTKLLIDTYPQKRFVFDAGALQMMDRNWLKSLKTTPIITPHKLEFETLFNVPISTYSLQDKEKIVREYAQEYGCIILLKTPVDIVSNGVDTWIIEGGNPGLTKGGTGDVLAGLVSALCTKNDPALSAVVGSFLLKYTGDSLFSTNDYWYNNEDLIAHIPENFKKLKLAA